MLGLLVLVAASAAAFKVMQMKVNSSKSEHCAARSRKHQHHTNDLKGKNMEEEVKLISSIIDDFEDDILPEFERLLSGEIEFPLTTDKTNEAKKDSVYGTEMANNAGELERLRNLVKELEERNVELEGELLEYYGLKELEPDILELQRQLKMKTVETDTLHITIDSLQAERDKLQVELTQGALAKRELEAARSKIKELQRHILHEANQTKDQLLLLKQQFSGLQAKEDEALLKKDAEIERKMKAVNDLEVEVVELRRKNKELQLEKRELTLKLDAAESRITELSNMTENEMVTRANEEVSRLRHVNEDLLKEVEGLQMNRFSEVEELAYLRWANACLRFELRNYQAPPGKLTACDLSKSLSPKSREKAKQLMLEYADLDSNYSHPFSPGSDDFDNVSTDSSTSIYSNHSKKTSIQKLKKMG